MFTELTRKNGSSRVVCYQFEDRLRRAGIDVRFFPPSPVFLYELAYEKIFRPRWLVLIVKTVYWYFLVFPCRLIQISRVGAFDVIFVQRGLLKYNSLPLLEWVLYMFGRKLLRKPLIYALDDAQYLVAPPRYFDFRFMMADWVYTGNPEITSYARRLNSNVMVIESVVDTDSFRAKQHSEHRPVVIGWSGTMLDNTGPLGLIRDAMVALSRRVPVVFEVVSNRSFEIGSAEVKILNRRWTLENEEENLKRFDVGIMPLPDDEYSRAKEGYKLKQYMAVGIPVVCSPVGQNKRLVKEGVTGFFASNQQEWVEKLALLVQDCGLRQRMGAAGRRFIEEQYPLSVAALKMADFFWDVYRRKVSKSVVQSSEI